MNYYTETNYIDHDSLRTAGGKGRDDYFEVLRRCGLKRIRIPTLRKPSGLPLIQRPLLERRLRKAWRKALSHLGEGDTLVLHSPVSEKFLAYPSVIKEVKNRGCRIIDIVFDLETFFMSDYRRFAWLKHEADRRTEAALFEMSDVIICHNERMKERIVSLGIQPDRIVCVGVMDYLSNPMDRDGSSAERDSMAERFRLEKPLVFCGNLAERKSGFVYRLAEHGIPGLSLDIYGPGYMGPSGTGDQQSGCVRYRGVYTAAELMSVMEGSFGLVWDGTSVETCMGACGEYLAYNNPHKMSHYLASGIPVLVWEDAAMADYVLANGCGLTIRDLMSVPDVLAGVSAEQYERLRLNAQKVGSEMRKGAHIRAAVQKALELSDSK